MATIDKILDEIQQLEFSDRILLTEILNKRCIEDERNRIALDAKKSLEEYRRGIYTPMTAKEGLDELKKYIDDQ